MNGKSENKHPPKVAAEPPPSEDAKFYLAQIGEASKRSRSVFYLLLVSTALIFSYHWKMRDGGWLDHRIQLRQDMITYWNDLGSTNIPLERVSGSNKTNILAAGYWWQITNTVTLLHRQASNSNDLAELQAELSALRKEWGSGFKVPFIEAVFDPNDFVLLSILELLVLSFVFLHCLIREEDNLKISFAAFGFGAESAHVDKCKLAELGKFCKKARMQQVWLLADREPTDYWQPLLQKGLWLVFFSPLAVQWWVFLEASWDWKAGHFFPDEWRVVAPGLGMVIMVIEFILLVLLSLLTVRSAKIFSEMNQLWAGVHDRISGEKPNQKD